MLVSSNLCIAQCHGWLPNHLHPRILCASHFKVNTLLSQQSEETQQQQQLKEPHNRFGNMAYWDESYRKSLGDIDDDGGDDGLCINTPYDSSSTWGTFSWYCGWKDELEPFFAELVPPESDPAVLVPGIGNDACIRDMFDAGYRRLMPSITSPMAWNARGGCSAPRDCDAWWTCASRMRDPYPIAMRATMPSSTRAPLTAST